MKRLFQFLSFLVISRFNKMKKDELTVIIGRGLSDVCKKERSPKDVTKLYRK